MTAALRILILEDQPDDAELMVHELQDFGYRVDWQRVDREDEYCAGLDQGPDVILADYTLPQFNTLAALNLLQERAMDIPFIVVSGSISEEGAVNCMKRGAADYLLKDRLARLGPAVQRALQGKRARDEQRRSEIALRISEERFRLLAENACDMIYRYRRWPTSGFDYVSPAALTITGYSPEEYYADPELNVKIAHPLDRHKLLTLIRGDWPLGEPMDLCLIRKDGSQVYVEHRMTQIHGEGRVIAIEGIVRDITSRRRAEEALRGSQERLQVYAERLVTLHEIDQGILAAHSEEEIAQAVLRKIRRLVPCQAAGLGLISEDQREAVVVAIAAEHETLWREGQRVPLPTHGRLAGLDQQRAWIVNHLFASSSEELLPWEADLLAEGVQSYLIVPLAASGEMLGVLVLAAQEQSAFASEAGDIACEVADPLAVAIQQAKLRKAQANHAAELEQRVAERTAELLQREAALRQALEGLAQREAELSAANESLRAATTRLMELDQMKSQFVSNVSHELRTPLTNIKLYLSLLENGKPEKRLQYLATLKREADLLQQLIENLLDLSRLDQGRIQPALERVDVNRLVKNLVCDRAALFADKGLDLQAQTAPEELAINADSRMLSQVVTNLMSNAMNYTPSGGKVTVRTGRSQSDCEWCTIVAVEDTGWGIAEEDLPHIFERFFRGEAGRQSTAQGTGLGLAICQEIIKRHEGWITVDSRVGVGSKFTVWLPAKES